MDRIAKLSERIQRLQRHVRTWVDEPWRFGLLEILKEVQRAIEIFPSPQTGPTDERIARAEAKTSALIASLRRKTYPPRPVDANELTILDRKSDLIRLLDLQDVDDTLVEYVVDLAREAVLNCDNLTLYVLTSGPLDLYYRVRKINSFQVHTKILGLLGRGAFIPVLETLVGKDGIVDLVKELRLTAQDLHVDREIRGDFLGSQTDLQEQSGLLAPLEDGLTSEAPTQEERHEIALIEQQFREIAAIADGLNEQRAELLLLAAPAPYPFEAPLDDRPTFKRSSPDELTRMPTRIAKPESPVNTVGVAWGNVAKNVPAWLTLIGTGPRSPSLRRNNGRAAYRDDWSEHLKSRVRFGRANGLLLLLPALLLAATIRLAFKSPPLAVMTTPAATAFVDVGRVGTPLPLVDARGRSDAITPTVTIPPRSGFLSSATLRPSIVPPPTLTPVPSELVVIAQGFGQDQQKVGYGFVVKNTSQSMVTDRTQYFVTAVDAGGNIVATAWGDVGVVLPLQTQGVAGTFIDPGDARVARIDVKLERVAFHLPWTKQMRSLLTDGPNASPDTNSPVVNGRVINPEPITFDGALVNAIAYDRTGTIIGGGATTVEPMPSNSQISVDVLVTTSTRPARIELYAAPSTLPSNQ